MQAMKYELALKLYRRCRMIELICICCPKGCHISVDDTNNYSVTGNSCPRGEEYAKSEATFPVRVVTSSVHIANTTIEKCPVKTDRPIPKAKIFEVMNVINKIYISAPVAIGDIILENVCGTDANIIVTKRCPALIR